MMLAHRTQLYKSLGISVTDFIHPGKNAVGALLYGEFNIENYCVVLL